MEFPSLGGSDLQGWMFKCDRFFQLDATPPSTKVRLASLHLIGKALEWHQSYVRSRGVLGEPPWEECAKDIKSRFGERVYEDAMADLKRLYQIGDLMDYIDAFDACAYKATLSDENVLSCFLTGFKDEISYPVLM